MASRDIEFTYVEDIKRYICEETLYQPSVIHVKRETTNIEPVVGKDGNKVVQEVTRLRDGLFSIEQTHVDTDTDAEGNILYSPIGMQTYFAPLIDIAMIDPAGVYPVYIKMTSEFPVTVAKIISPE